MATKRTNTKSKAAKKPTKATTKAVVKKKGATINTATRHPRARVVSVHTSKADLAKSLAASIARPDQDTDMLEVKLRKSSNKQLLRLAKLAEMMKQKWGNREKLIAAIGMAAHKSKDKAFLAKLDTYSLPQLFDLAVGSERRSRTSSSS